ncbi:outer membrane beta-barrel protein [Gelatiniphilus marinus]|uniref:Outer membrane beta-barrel protein n=1 Tax=Gelatiniphilus marinus TaxID=1759464 RepID=A0ABW5JV71_9FLAO
MHFIFRNISTLTIITVLFSNITNAQPNKGRHIDISIGYGFSTTSDELDLYGKGFYLQGEYVFGLTRWFGLRPYAGFITTSHDENASDPNLTGFEVTTKAFLFGGKARVSIPIPWIAPYLEIGIGGSLGSFTTFTPNVNKKENGFLMHIPLSFGLALGPNYNIEVAATYYFHPTIEQVSGAAALGFSIPLN